MHPLLSTVSDDPSYGFAPENPVRLGPKGPMSAPAAARHYLRSLRNANGRPFEFRRNGSAGPGPDGHVLDQYILSSAPGEAIGIYVDMYHPDHDPDFQAAPLGMSKGSPYTYDRELSAPPPSPLVRRWWQFWK